jgi:integrase
MLFGELAERYLAHLNKRLELGKIKPASLDTFVQRTRTHVIPALGALDILEVRNGKVKAFAEMLATKLSRKTVQECVMLVKMILEAHVDPDGEPLLDLKWNNRFIFQDVKDIGQQKQPTISQDDLNAVLKNQEIKVRDRVLIALAGSTGLRISELLALRYLGGSRSTTWDAGDMIHVRKSIFKGQLQEPKTKASVRDIDISAPAVKMLEIFCQAENKKPGDYIFAKGGKPMTRSDVHHGILAPVGIPGAHSLRRRRATHLDEQGTPRALVSAWMGHSTKGEGMSSLYIKSQENLQFRRQHCERVGTGLDLVAAILPQSKREEVEQISEEDNRDGLALESISQA